MTWSPRPPRRRLINFLIVIVALIVCYVYAGRLLNAAARSLIRIDPFTTADVVIALGGDARCWREKAAADLFKEGRARALVVSGVPHAWGVHTGEAARRYVESLGVPREQIFVLQESWNTRREAIDLDELMRRQGWKSAIIVTSPFHSRRAYYTFQRYAGDFTFYSAPLTAAPPEWQPEGWWTRRSDLGVTIREFMSWGNTLVGGLR
jgi:uncharacterized SAM-binding protein YcdF (DUF218 family)